MAATAPTAGNELRSSRSRLTKGGRRITYQMSVVQQPERARACGQGAKSTTDRRPVDPPPIVDLRIFEGEEGHLTDITFSYRANIFLFASLENARSSTQSRPGQQASGAPVLTGTPVAGISYLDRPNPAGYFIFPDLSVRHEGKYRLTFNLFEELKDPKDEDNINQLPNHSSYIHGRCEVKTAPFTVFSAKKFPGLMESTSLSRMVADQGCRVRIRRDVRMRRRETKAQEKWNDYEDETAHERAKREASPGEYAGTGNAPPPPPPPQAATQAPVPPVAPASGVNNTSNGNTYNSSSDGIRQQDVTTSYLPQAPHHQSQQQMTPHGPSAYPPYLQYDAAQMQHYMAQHPNFAQYPQQAAAYGYPNQPMMSYTPGYGYMGQQGMHQAPMYEQQMQHHAVEYMPPPPPPPSSYPRQSVGAAPAYPGQTQSQQGNDMRQGQPSEQNYMNQMPMSNMPIPVPAKGLPRPPNNGLYNGRVGNGVPQQQQQQAYTETPRNVQHYNQGSSVQKRSFGTAFDGPSYDQARMQYPPRPQISTFSRPAEHEGASSNNDDQSSDAESLEIEQMKMTYRRADGSERTRTWPQLRT